MQKKKLFLENFLIYGLSGIISKIIPLLMIPIITRLMPDTSFFGVSDMSTTVVSFGSALAIMGMYDAMYRMFFDKDDEEYKKDICSTALVFTISMSIVIFFIMVMMQNFIAEKFFGNMQYTYLVYITAIATLVGATNAIVSAPTRMQNKRKVFLLMNTLSPIISYSISIPLLIHGRYLIALPLAGMFAGISSEIIFLLLNKQWFKLKRFNWTYLKQLLLIGVPLLPNFLIYWVFNSSDKLMITNLINTSATGVYSVGSKLGHVSQLIYTAFAGGWQYFAFSTMKEENQVNSNSRIFEYLGIISFTCTMFVFVFCSPVYKILFTGDYVKGYIVSPYLFLAPLLQMLFQVACNQFLVIKKTWPNMFILSSGAIVNVILNYILIPKIGIEGAAIATLIGYTISDIVVVVVLIRMKLMNISGRFLICTIIIGIFIVFWRLFLKEYILISFLISLICITIFMMLYKDDFKILFKVEGKKK
ncbi:oligosaccharide flippase family protein [Clostridium thermarum]|uniref:oligosaccharide flippase family protein n=1 Tax=Clostridium thermarum TaxID=1716543 RepID=UPI0013D0D7CF|nr:oligosaccharide flippase family protein [Clostridium thermarum]